MDLGGVFRLCVVSLVVYISCASVLRNADSEVKSSWSQPVNKTQLSLECELNDVKLQELRVKIPPPVRVKRAFRFRRSVRIRFRRRRGSSINIGQLIRNCQASCWGGWKPFGACSVQCGSSGVQYSYRDRSVSSQCTGIINSHGCPGPSSRSQRCTQSCRNGGTLQATSCSCPAGFNGPCCQNRVTCGFPGKPSNGGVSNAATSQVYNSRVTYSCVTGYSLQGATDNQCLATGSWKNTVPTCRRITCSKPSLKAHVAISPSRGSYDYGTRVVFSCAEGHTLQGQTSSQCTGTWSNPSPTCRAITCPSLTPPTSGGVNVNTNNYRGVATYSCSHGHHLSGSTRRTCQISGQWDGSAPSCTRITCPRVSAPSNGKVNQPSSATLDNAATYSCNSGYELRGNQRRTCNYGNSATGSWSGSAPSCSAVSCGQPTTPAHGTRSGTTFTYGGRVSFRCEAGYYLQGAETITCGANKAWSSANTRCTACPLNQYKEGTNSARSCTACSSNSRTTSTASTQRSQCICNRGYEGNNGGPCNVIKCPAISAPAHGVIGACAVNYQSTCSVTCLGGYIRHGGDETRTCLLNKRWSGTPPTCKACPKNTYKSGSTECTNCPINSATVGEGSSRSNCVCKSGFTGTPGQQCNDVNECAARNGGCDQVCTNLPGTHQCSCNQGFIKDSSDYKKCVAKNSCPALDRPTNGGLVCHAQMTSRTERCSVKCNAGYQHILRPNQYEECGPSTNFRWTTEANMTPILGCIESFFDEISIDGEASYFTTSCESVTGSVLREVQLAFIATLKQKGICMESATCSIDDVRVECGPQSRGKRSAQGAGANQLTIKFKVKVPSRSKVDPECKAECDAKSGIVLFEECFAACEADIERERVAMLKEAAAKLRREALAPSRGPTGSNSGSSSNLGGVTVSRQGAPPRQSGVLSTIELLSNPVGVATVSSIRSSCDTGMEFRNGTCVPCAAGSYLRAGSCVLCPRDQYQPRPRQTTCLRCAEGFHASSGATACTQSPTEEPVDFFVVIRPKGEQ